MYALLPSLHFRGPLRSPLLPRSLGAATASAGRASPADSGACVEAPARSLTARIEADTGMHFASYGSGRGRSAWRLSEASMMSAVLATNGPGAGQWPRSGSVMYLLVMPYTQSHIRASRAQLPDVELGLQTGFGILLVELPVRCTGPQPAQAPGACLSCPGGPASESKPGAQPRREP